MSPETAFLNDEAVLWLPSGSFDEEGRRTVLAGAEITVRWEDRKGEYRNDQGEPVAYDAWIASAVDTPVGSLLRQGTLAQWAAAEAGPPPRGLYEVIDARKADDLLGENTRREARLARYRDELPEVVSP